MASSSWMSPRVEMLQSLQASVPGLNHPKEFFFSPTMCNFPCCYLCLLPLPVCCASSRRVWLQLLCNCLLDSGRLQLGLFLLAEQASSLSLFSHAVYSSLLTILLGFCLTCCTFSAPLTVGSPKLDTVLQTRSQMHCAKGKHPLPWPAGYAAAHAAQDAVGLLHCKGALLALVQLAVYQDNKGLFFKNMFVGCRNTLRIAARECVPENVLHPFSWVLGCFRLSQFGFPRMK